MTEADGQALPFLIAGGGIGGLVTAYALARIGLKEAMLADAWRPGAQEMRCALSGECVTRIPLDDNFTARFQQPYAVTHRSDMHAVTDRRMAVQRCRHAASTTNGDKHV
jgi:flavin-dependent dehydrogenase